MSIAIDKNVAVSMRDGTLLRADIYRPPGSGPHPVLLQRTPYNREFLPLVTMTLDPIRAASAGFTVVIQDVRARWASEGDVFTPYNNEAQDGLDTLDWLAEQSFCDGNIGAYGLSYMGGTTWLNAVSGHPALKAISPTTAPNDFWHDHFWRGGALHLSTLVSWALRVIGPAALLRRGLEPVELGTRLAELAEALDRFDETVSQRPLNKLGAARPEDEQFVPFVFEMMQHSTPDDWTASRLFSNRHDQVKVPALIIAGWHDLLLGADLSHYRGMIENGGSKSAREQTRLVVGPWSHAMFLNYVGQVDFGFRSSGYLLDIREDLTQLQLRWFNRWLRGMDEAFTDPPVRIFVQGKNRWRDETEWPPRRAETTPWYLHAGNRLGPEQPAVESSCNYVYDPEDPCPTLGGNLLMPPQYTPGPVAQTAILDRRDVVSFTSKTLGSDLEITGPVTVDLHASTSALDTDWVVKLCDVHPDGRTFNVCDGVLRASHQLREHNLSMTPGDTLCWHLDLWATSHVFAAGHQIRLLVTSSDFPRYDRNPNTGETGTEATASVPALQRIYLGPGTPSCVNLPVVPGK
ncbi:MAG TPA: X-Pro dipeptidyl-peptidase [Porticoccaceae bacterium]|nr:X-Pro dipeptidyl-peptidase [Porticoccaceae bacterium]